MTDKIKCEHCGDTTITFYRQLRKDGEWVVTARCENGHSPIKGKPFYPKYQFKIASLPKLGEPDEKQPALFAEDTSGLDLIEQKQRMYAAFDLRRKV